MSLSSLAIPHLLLRLQPLNRALAAAVERQKAVARRIRPELSSLCVTEEHVNLLLEQLETVRSGGSPLALPAQLSDSERAYEVELRESAREHGRTLPLDQLAAECGLAAFDQEALLLCTGPELDRNYERVYGFVLDDLNRRFASIELMVSLTAGSLKERIARRHALSSFGRLRRFGILAPLAPAPTDLRQEFRLAPGVFEFLTGAGHRFGQLLQDPAEIQVPASTKAPPQMEPHRFAHLVTGVQDGSISKIAVWGPRQHGVSELVIALAAASGRPLRQLSLSGLEQPGTDPLQLLQERLRVAVGLDALLWMDADELQRDLGRRLEQPVVQVLAGCPVPLVLTGERPWRQPLLLRNDGYVEVELLEPRGEQRHSIWSRSFPELAPQAIEDLAVRFSLATEDVESVSKLARTRARLAGNGVPDDLANHVDAACSVVTNQASSHFTTMIVPRRGPGDLILRPDLHSQVLEVATFFRLRARVDETWGFGRMANGSGVKVLFTGEAGTGKTLAAEVIAGQVGVPLFRVDLARVVSKWVGETELNLENAFREAEQNHGVLFFDEAEALFGKRGEIHSGTDRWANLEVSFLLQRLENSRGLIVILASNVRDSLDSAFARRFHVVVHFPKPALEERRRIWKLAFPPEAPVAEDVDLQALAALDMTGAAIMTTARSAALLAADSGQSSITMADVIRSAARQFRREARVLTASDLGPYASLLQGAP